MWMSWRSRQMGEMVIMVGGERIGEESSEGCNNSVMMRRNDGGIVSSLCPLRVWAFDLFFFSSCVIGTLCLYI
jgi:hypothetical protein